MSVKVSMPALAVSASVSTCDIAKGAPVKVPLLANTEVKEVFDYSGCSGAPEDVTFYITSPSLDKLKVLAVDTTAGTAIASQNYGGSIVFYDVPGAGHRIELQFVLNDVAGAVANAYVFAIQE